MLLHQSRSKPETFKLCTLKGYKIGTLQKSVGPCCIKH